MSKTLVEKLKSANVIQRGRVKLRSGKTSSFYIDIKKAYGNPELMNQIADELWAKIDKQATCLAAAGYGGIPLAAVISSKYDIPVALVRDKVKTHGIESIINGYVPTAKDKVAIVDDVLTTGSSLKDTIENLKATEATIIGCYVVAKRGEATLPAPVEHLVDSESIKLG
jgi:orotate phosphoribosyltransferase